MQLLHLCNDYIIKLNKFQKFELYFILTVILFTLFYFFTYEELKYAKKIEKKTYITSLKIVTKTELWAKQNKIKINKIDVSKSLIKFEISSSLKNIINFVYYVQNLTQNEKINYLDLLYNKKTKKFNLNFLISHDGIKKDKNSFSKLNIKNVFKSFVKEKLFILSAIYGEYIVLNNRILELNDYIKDYKIIKITQNEVHLKLKEKTKIIKVRNDEKY